MAWLQAVPDDQNDQRGNLLESGDSRQTLPDATHLYLIDALISIGVGRSADLEPHHRDKKTYLYRNLHPVTFSEIRDWCELTGTKLTPWESETLRVLSEAYVVQLSKSHNPNAEPPHDARSLNEMRDRTHNQFQRLFKQAGGKPRG